MQTQATAVIEKTECEVKAWQIDNTHLHIKKVNYNQCFNGELVLLYKLL